MTLHEAIETLEYHRAAVADVAGSDYANALKLAIEALKEIHRNRPIFAPKNIHLLPGETKD